MEKILYINRGLPGSGKSYTAEKLAPSEQIFSADNFFTKDWHPQLGITKKELYDLNWNQDLVYKAHWWNNSNLHIAMQKGISPLVLDNTHVKRKEYTYPLELAKKYGYKVEIKEPESPWWKAYRKHLTDKNPEKLAELVDILHQKNSHGVSKQKLLKMAERWQDHNDSV